MKIKDILVVLAAVIWFSVMAIYKIDLPGFHENEAFQVVPTLEMLENKIFIPSFYSFKILGKNLPIMLTPFLGTFNSYVLIPIVYIFGLTVKVIRLSQIFFGALGIFLTYILCKESFNRKIAVVSTFLLTLNPSFILFNRQGLLVSSINLPITILGVLLILWWYLKGKKGYLYLGFFLLGIPLWSSSNFLWFIIALVVSCQIIFKKDIHILFTEGRLKRNDIVILLYCLLLGAGPFIWYNIEYRESIQKFIVNFNEYYKSQGISGYFEALRENIRNFIFMLSGAYNSGSYGVTKGIINNLYPILFLVSAVLSPFLLIRRKDTSNFKKIFFLILIVVFILLQAPFSLNDASAYNLYILYPFIQIIIAVFLLELYYYFLISANTSTKIVIFLALLGILEVLVMKGHLHFLVAVAFLVGGLYFFIKRKEVVYFLISFACVFVFLEVATLRDYYYAMDKSGGIKESSDAIYSLAGFLKNNKELKPVAMDWGFRNRLYILTNGEIKAKEFYSGAIKKNRFFYRMCERLLERPEILYLTNSPDLDISGTWQLFKKNADSKNIPLKMIKSFCQRDGKEVIFVYQRGYEYVLFDFMKNFSKAKVGVADLGRVGIANFFMNGDTKKVLFEHPSSEIRYTLKLSKKAVLKFSIGISENCWDKGDGVKGEIYVQNDDKEVKIFSKYLNPHYRLKDRGQFEYMIDLSEFSGEEVDIVFKTFPGPKSDIEGDYDADWWGWGDPVLVKRY